MDFFKNKNFQIGAAFAVAFGTAFYLYRSRSTTNSHGQTSSKISAAPRSLEAQTSIKEKFDKIYQNGNRSSSTLLSKQQINIVFQHLAITNLNTLSSYQSANILNISNYKSISVKQLIQKFVSIFKAQEKANQQNSINNQNIIKSLGIKVQDVPAQGQIQSQINQWLYDGVNQQHKKLAIQFLDAKANYIRFTFLDDPFLTTLKQLIPTLSQDQFKYIPFILDLIITAKVSSDNISFNENSSKIYLAIRKYNQSLSSELSQWSNLSFCLQNQLNML